MLVFPLAALETDIPTADYELEFGEESNESESMDIAFSSYSPVSSVLVTNESVMDPSNYWDALHYPGEDSNYYAKVVNVPYLNVSDLMFTVTTYIVEGPLELSMKGNSTIGQAGEHCQLVVHEIPEVNPDFPERASTDYIRITFNSTNWEDIDEIYFSLEVTFTEIVCPVKLDLQRTNGECMGQLQEFRTVYDYTAIPTIQFGDFPFIVTYPNVTVYLPNGNYSVRFQWLDYSHSFSNLTILNESLYITLRIRSTRLDVNSLQKIPFIAIRISYSSYDLDKMYEDVMIKDSPSFYVPSENTVRVFVIGRPITPQLTQHKSHFDFYLNTGGNRNVTLSVNENWIMVGTVAFSPARWLMVLSSIVIIILTLAIGRKEIKSSPVYAPFLLLLVGSLLPVINVTFQKYIQPLTYPLYSPYSVTTSTSLTFATLYSTTDNSVTTISSIGIFNGTIMSSLSFFILFIAYSCLVFEILKVKENSLQEIFFIMAIILMPVLQLRYYFSLPIIFYNDYIVSLSIGFLLTVIAPVIWLVQSIRRNWYSKLKLKHKLFSITLKQRKSEE